MTWIELVQEYVEAAGHSMMAVRVAGYVGIALLMVGGVFGRASEAEEFPDSEAPELDDRTGLLVEARIDEVLRLMMIEVIGPEAVGAPRSGRSRESR